MGTMAIHPDLGAHYKQNRGRAGDNLDVMVIDARTVPVAARERYFGRGGVGVCRVACSE
jgi:hypothetical protein